MLRDLQTIGTRRSNYEEMSADACNTAGSKVAISSGYLRSSRQCEAQEPIRKTNALICWVRSESNLSPAT